MSLIVRDRDTSGETGSSLIVALVLLVAVGPLLTALVSLTGSNVISTSNLQGQRDVEFSANSVVEGAIEAIRHQPPSSLTNPNCPAFPNSASSFITINAVNVVVECSMGIPVPCTNAVPTQCSSINSFGRDVEFDACRWITGGVTFSTCQSSAIVRAELVYNDVSPAAGCSTGYSLSSIGQYCYGYSGNWWGTGMTIASWVVQPANG